jgi:hypothetical protein
MNKTRLSYWFPKLEAAGLPVPKTHIIKASEDELKAIWESFETSLQSGLAPLVERAQEAAEAVGYPAFLRTDYFSGKHNWEKTCYITEAGNIAQHIVDIAYFWESVNMVAPKSDVWVVREFLPTLPHGICRNYGNMPICKEFRFFVDGGKLLCWHPYWPEESLRDGGAAFDNPHFDYKDFCTSNVMDELIALAVSAGSVVGGKWSVDILETSRGWYITDMAEAHKSFHWEGCPNQKLI